MTAIPEPPRTQTAAVVAPAGRGPGTGLKPGSYLALVIGIDLFLLALFVLAFTLDPTEGAVLLIKISVWGGLAALLTVFVLFAGRVWHSRGRPPDPDPDDGGGGGGPPNPRGPWRIIAVLIGTAAGIVVVFAVAYWAYYPTAPAIDPGVPRTYPASLDALHAVHGSLSTLATLGLGVDPCAGRDSCLKPTGLLVVEMIQAIVGLVFLSGAVSVGMAAVADRIWSRSR